MLEVLAGGSRQRTRIAVRRRCRDADASRLGHRCCSITEEHRDRPRSRLASLVVRERVGHRGARRVPVVATESPARTGDRAVTVHAERGGPLILLEWADSDRAGVHRCCRRRSRRSTVAVATVVVADVAADHHDDRAADHNTVGVGDRRLTGTADDCRSRRRGRRGSRRRRGGGGVVEANQLTRLRELHSHCCIRLPRLTDDLDEGVAEIPRVDLLLGTTDQVEGGDRLAVVPFARQNRLASDNLAVDLGGLEQGRRQRDRRRRGFLGVRTHPDQNRDGPRNGIVAGGHRSGSDSRDRHVPTQPEGRRPATGTVLRIERSAFAERARALLQRLFPDRDDLAVFAAVVIDRGVLRQGEDVEVVLEMLGQGLIDRPNTENPRLVVGNPLDVPVAEQLRCRQGLRAALVREVVRGSVRSRSGKRHERPKETRDTP